jgi:hypothetical protein
MGITGHYTSNIYLLPLYGNIFAFENGFYRFGHLSTDTVT